MDAACVVGDAGGCHPDGQQQAEGVHAEMSLAARDFLAGVNDLVGVPLIPHVIEKGPAETSAGCPHRNLRLRRGIQG